MTAGAFSATALRCIRTISCAPGRRSALRCRRSRKPTWCRRIFRCTSPTRMRLPPCWTSRRALPCIPPSTTRTARWRTAGCITCKRRGAAGCSARSTGWTKTPADLCCAPRMPLPPRRWQPRQKKPIWRSRRVRCRSATGLSRHPSGGRGIPSSGGALRRTANTA